MAKKFIIINDFLIMGNVKFHRDLIPSGNPHRPIGGGYWHITPEKELWLYGRSEDFGRCSEEKVKMVIGTGRYFDFGKKVDEVYFSDADLFAEAKMRYTEIPMTPPMMDAPPTESSMAITNNRPPEEKTVKPETYRREGSKTHRNDPCPCKSGKKHKNCCMNK